MVDSNRSLQAVEQKTVEFYEDELVAIRASDGHIYVSLRHLCNALGIDAQAQTRRIRRQSVLEKGLQQIPILTPERGEQQAYVIRVDLVPLLLSGISTKAVSEEVRPKLEQFQEEAAKALWEAFQEGRLTADPSFDELLKRASDDVVEAYQIAQAIMKLARNQVVLEVRIDEHGRQLEDYGRRLETIEADMHQEDRYISESQATQISQAIKVIAIALGKQTGRNEFGATWGEFYRKFGIAKYRYLPISRFDEAMAWLNEFYQDLTGESPF
ncbi:MAG: ORF6C domain-containing protein [Caldilineaceae bacterium]|nr:ORF6C domain-containing protein [Caldilineaceae bacterium]